MFPSSTVENYLKTIYQGQGGLPSGQSLVPMGQLAGQLGVAPGTATTMVKALAESGLVRYEPYSGVRLTAAGEKLAALVLRRHRLVELFLVRVMGMSWTEVHDEAEKLEHAVSDRLIDRIDEMLGRPEADPHGDPIPDSEGAVRSRPVQNLLTCPLNTPVTVTRVADQEAAFLHFIERSNLKPGTSIQVEARDPAADSVVVSDGHQHRITIGARAASKLLVEVLQLLLIVLLGTGTAHAQTASASDSSRPFEILDNSFVIEEAFNQEATIFQNIFTFIRLPDSVWRAAFVQEWPVPGQRHQLSYTLPFAHVDGNAGPGDVLLNYRYQALAEGLGRPAIAARLSLVVPSGREEKGLGSGAFGWEVNVPVSKQVGDLYVHANAGFTYWPRVDSPGDNGSPPHKVALLTPRAGVSGIWRLRPMVHLMLETLLESSESLVFAGATARDLSLIVGPGVRGGWNVGSKQIVVGASMPATITEGGTDLAVLGYFSYELPFTK